MTTSAPARADETATHREIVQQPDSWQRLVVSLDDRRAELDAFLQPLLADPELRIVLTGAGTSAFVGDIASVDLRRHLGRRVESIATTDVVADPHGSLGAPGRVLLVSFARSGNSPESVAATRVVDDVAPGAHHLVVTCDPAGALAREHRGKEGSFVLEMPSETNDTGFAMTSSFSTMLLAVLLAFRPELVAGTGALVAAARTIAGLEARITSLAEGTERVVYLGSGALQGLARESALKLLELTAGGVVSFFDTPLGFRHGPKAVAGAHTLVVVYGSADPYTAQYDADILRELRADGAVRVVSVGGDADDERSFPLDDLAGLDDALRSVALVGFAQLLALATSVAHGCTPDNPFPGGTVNRVVQGVTIHDHREGAARP
ncbi:SIS domain-containing protein [Curtobacterium sp. TXMA1]|uniref:SIS domain-containing protein n=1 Tax=Curtobacterium sp. TXMA1 TaxID=2876939 RepID=UPI001CD031A3|nr:SIS domain-containing protein [Curtobacterium sp. TXMA1]UBQ02782.1 SIS domain-containing protein [Curtobacterium sp. TXMA1]